MDEVLCPITGCNERARVVVGAVCEGSAGDLLELVVKLRMALLVGEGGRTCDWRRQGLSGGVLGCNGMVNVVVVEVEGKRRLGLWWWIMDVLGG